LGQVVPFAHLPPVRRPHWVVDLRYSQKNLQRMCRGRSVRITKL